MTALPKDVEHKLLGEVILEGLDDYVERGSQLEKALFTACGGGDLKKLIEILQTNNIGVNVRLSEGAWTPLMFAIKYNRQGMVDFLLKQPRISLSVRDHAGQTALSFALNPLSDFFKPNYGIARKLVNAGADANEMLAMAWMTRNEEVADKLISEFGARIDLAEGFVNSDIYKSYATRWSQTMKSTMDFAARILHSDLSLNSDTYKRYAGRWDEFNPRQNVVTFMQQHALQKVTEQPIREREPKSKAEWNFEQKTDCEIITHIVQQCNLPISECECPAFRRDTADNVRDYIPVLLIQELQKRLWPKDCEVVITDIGAGNLKQAATIACALVKSGYSIKFNLIDTEYSNKKASEKLMVGFKKILEILNNAFSGKARINAYDQRYEADKHTADFLLIIDGIDRLEGFGKKGPFIYENFCRQAKTQNPKVMCVATKECSLNVNVMCNDKVEKYFSYQFPKVMRKPVTPLL